MDWNLFWEFENIPSIGDRSYVRTCGEQRKSLISDTLIDPYMTKIIRKQNSTNIKCPAFLAIYFPAKLRFRT